MKKSILSAFIIASLVILGCSKQNNSPAPVLTTITGTWKYIGYSGGLIGQPFTPVDTIENYIQVDTLNARILLSVNGTQACSAYTFNNDDNAGLLNITDSITFTHTFDIYLSHDTLTLYPHNYADAVAASYAPVAKHFNWCEVAIH